MKTNSNIRPNTIEPVGNGSYNVNYNVTESLYNDSKSYNYEAVTVWGYPIYESVVSEIIKEKFSYDYREAAIRKGIVNPNDPDYIAFNDFAENTKLMVKDLLKNVQL